MGPQSVHEQKTNMKEILLTLTYLLAFSLCFPKQEDQLNSKIVNRIPELCTTKQAELCVFPFTYRGVRYEKCTYARSATPWCATQTNNDGVVITNKWGDCSLDGDSECEVEQTQPKDNPSCVTVGGPSPNKKCIFPFTHGGVVYNECTTAGLGQSWCSVAVYSNGTHISGQGLYGLCPSTCPGGQDTCSPGRTWQVDCNTCTCSLLSTPHCTEKMCNDSKCSVIEGPAQGQECVFPFVWGGRRFTSCTQWTYGGQHQDKLWCSTKTDSQDRHINGQGNFGFCSSSCDSVNNDVDYQLDTDFGVNSRSKFVNIEERDPTAIMFTDNQDDDDAVKMPPS